MLLLALSSLVVLGYVELYITSEHNFRYIQGLAHIQSTGRKASALFHRAVSHAGFMGCRPLGAISHGSVAPVSVDTNFSKGVSGNDTFSLRNMAVDTAVLLTDMTTSSELVVTGQPRFRNQQPLVIADCLHYQIFTPVKVARRRGQQLIVSDAPMLHFNTGAMVGRWLQQTYYIRKTTRNNKQGHAIYSLYRQTTNGRSEELLAGVERMAITLGVRQGDSGSRLTSRDGGFQRGKSRFSPFGRRPCSLAAQAIVLGKQLPGLAGSCWQGDSLVMQRPNQVTDWQQVRLVRVTLLLTSIEAIIAKPQPIAFMGEILRPQDQQLRKVWQIDIALENYGD
tara:strand:- start:3526 stop:4536 length:1011 start_codon:yes stop_codon:yes gene_type:complete